ncbi:unnamed protein product [Durusdinium trenchii]|uniref:Uncharacterized protein n=1 Tax=Durusdinium trenchii TaxID=1381693 RepID=A0ABP0LH39_9DINO
MAQDAGVPVVEEAKEWKGATGSDDEGDADEHATSSFRARERRLSMAEEVRKEEQIMGDTQVEVVKQQDEWKGGDDSEEEQAEPVERTAQRRASESFEKRESRIQQGALVRSSFSQSEPSVMSFEQTGRAAASTRDSDRCSDRCTNMCVLA